MIFEKNNFFSWVLYYTKRYSINENQSFYRQKKIKNSKNVKFQIFEKPENLIKKYIYERRKLETPNDNY